MIGQHLSNTNKSAALYFAKKIGTKQGPGSFTSISNSLLKHLPSKKIGKRDKKKTCSNSLVFPLAKFLIRACRYPPRHRAIPHIRFPSRAPGESSGPYSRRPRTIFFFIAPYAELLPVLSPAGN